MPDSDKQLSTSIRFLSRSKDTYNSNLEVHNYEQSSLKSNSGVTGGDSGCDHKLTTRKVVWFGGCLPEEWKLILWQLTW